MARIKKFFPLYLVIFFGFLGYSLMITVFTPMMLKIENGILPLEVSFETRSILLGVLLSLYPLGQFLGSPILGSFSDHFGRKPILIASLVFTTIFYAWISLSMVFNSLIFLMIGTFLAGLSESNIAIAQSAIVDVFEKQERSRLFGYLYLTVSLAYIFGPLFGGKIAGYFHYSTPFWWVFLLLVFITLWIVIGFKETYVSKKKGSVRYLDSFLNIVHIFTEKKIRIFYGVNFLIYLSVFGFFLAYPMYLVKEYHLGVSKLSEYIAWVAVPIIFVNLYFIGAFAKKFNPRKILVGSAFLTAAFLLLFILPKEQKALWITLFLAAGAVAFCLPNCPAILSTSVEEEFQGRVLGNNQSLQFAVESFSGIIAGILISLYIKLPILIFSLLAFLGGLTLLLSHKMKRKASLE